MKAYMLSAIALVGCTSSFGDNPPIPSVYGRHFEVQINPTVPANYASHILDAVDDWNTNIPGTLTVKFVACDMNAYPAAGVICINVVPEGYIQKRFGAPAVADGGNDGEEYIGYTIWDNAGANVFLDETMGDSVVQQSVAHEVGHGMALIHTGTGTLMCWSTSCQSRTLTADDIDQWYNTRGY
jgi:hypothetical protein